MKRHGAHLDIAGTAMGAPKTEINQSWGSGYGVRPAGPVGRGILRSLNSPRNHCDLMTEVLFYHLQNMSLENVLPSPA